MATNKHRLSGRLEALEHATAAGSGGTAVVYGPEDCDQQGAPTLAQRLTEAREAVGPRGTVIVVEYVDDGREAA